MEVDTTAIDISTAKPKVQCFFCNNEGHIKKDCHKFKALAENKGSGPPKKAKARAVTRGTNVDPCFEMDINHIIS